MKGVLIAGLGLLINFSAMAESKKAERPFEPAFAAEQHVITSRSIEFEGKQFDSIGQWQIARDRVETQRLEKEQAEENLERTRKLFQKGVATEAEFKNAEYQVQSAISNLQIAIDELEIIRASGLRYKYLLLDEGDNSRDYRLDVANALKVIHLQTGKIYESQLEGARAGVEYWTYQVGKNRELFEKRLIKKSTLERSEIYLQTSKDELATIGHKINTNKLAIEGVDKTIKALTN